MRIEENATRLLPRLDRPWKHNQEGKADWHTGQLPVNRPAVDLLEISSEARQLAADAITNHEAVRLDNLPKRPAGAPDDYINPEQLMKRFEPESYAKFQDAMARNPVEGLSLLLKFAKQVPKHPDWIAKYREENP